MLVCDARGSVEASATVCRGRPKSFSSTRTSSDHVLGVLDESTTAGDGISSAVKTAATKSTQGYVPDALQVNGSSSTSSLSIARIPVL